jgi:hypothetical protein
MPQKKETGMAEESSQQVYLMFLMEDTSRLEQSQAVERLQNQLRGRLLNEGYDEVAKSLQRVREDPQKLDLGVTLGVVLAAPAVVTIARGIADFVRSLAPKATKLELRRPDGTTLRIETRSAEEIQTALHAAVTNS